MPNPSAGKRPRVAKSRPPRLPSYWPIRLISCVLVGSLLFEHLTMPYSAMSFFIVYPIIAVSVLVIWLGSPRWLWSEVRWRFGLNVIMVIVLLFAMWFALINMGKLIDAEAQRQMMRWESTVIENAGR